MHLLTRRLAATTLGLLTFLAGLTLSAAPAAAEPASISGTVLEADTGQPPTGACVYAYRDSDGSLAAGTCIDPQTGAYILDSLEAGIAYRIQVRSGAPYPQEMWWPGGPTINDAQAVVAPATVDVSLPLAGTLVGTLMRSDGSPAADEFVTVFLADREEAFGRFTRTGADGSWRIGDLYPTAYKVAFGGAYSAWAFGKSDWASADTVAVAAGATVRVDDTLFLPASISGTVRDESTGDPIEGSVFRCGPWIPMAAGAGPAAAPMRRVPTGPITSSPATTASSSTTRRAASPPSTTTTPQIPPRPESCLSRVGRRSPASTQPSPREPCSPAG